MASTWNWWPTTGRKEQQGGATDGSGEGEVPLLEEGEDEGVLRTVRLRVMEALVWHKVAAISGVAALGLGTYGAHMYKPANPVYKDVWHTASLYHLVHTTALLAAPLTKRPHLFGGLLTFGIVAFSGTCYTVAFYEDRKFAFPAPFGGFAFMAAWASLLF